MIKEERKRVEAEQVAKMAKLVDLMVKKPSFVLEADMLYDRYGNSKMVSSTINFILADSTYGVIQVGDNQYLGRNGLGGVTIDGTITSYEYSVKKKNNVYYLSYTLRSPVGSYDVQLTVQPSGRAEARVNGNFSSGTLRYAGKLVHPAISKVFQGTSY